MDITVDSVSVRYGRRNAIADVSCRLAGGRVTAVMGPNGSGKSTLLNVVAGLVEPASGTIDPPAAALKSAYVLQHPIGDHWLPLTAGEVIVMGRYGDRGLVGRLGREDRAIVAVAADRLEVADLLKRQLGELSGGQRQRVVVAQAIARRADVLLLDEPITGLDLASQERIVAVTREEADAGRVVVVTTHHLEEAAATDHVLLLATRLVASGEPGDVLTADRLREAYGDRVISAAGEAGSGVAVVDDHGHDHEH